jgi:hypothetical protein
MPLSLEETKSLIAALGVNIADAILEAKAKAEDFKARQEKLAGEAGEKTADWQLKRQFDDLLKRAAELAGKQEFEAGLKLLDEAGQLLRQPESAPAASGEKVGFSIVQLQKSRLAWDSLRKSVQAQLQELEHAILAGVRAHNEDETAEDEFEEGEVGSAVKSLYRILDRLDERLIDKLDEALNANTEEQRQARHQEAAGIIKEYQAFAASDPTLAMIDENGFTQSTIRNAVASTLADLAGKF